MENITFSSVLPEKQEINTTKIPSVNHKHNYNELFVCFKNSIKISTENGIIELHENEIAIVPGEISHNASFEYENSQWFAFGYFVKKNKNSHTEDFYNLFSVVKNEIIKLKNPKICKNIFEIVNEDKNSKLYALKLCEIVYSVCLLINDNKFEENVDITTNLLAKIDRLINLDYAKNVTLKELSNKFYLSEKQISRIILKTYKKPFNEVIFDKRIEVATFLLENTDKKIYEISEDVGFSSTKNFYKEFKKRHNITPNQFKKVNKL